MDAAAFDTLTVARDLEAAGMDRTLAEVTASNMQLAGTAHLDQLATKTELKTESAATKTELKAEITATKSELKTEIAATRSELKAEIATLKADMLKVAIGIVIANAGFVIAAVKFL